MSAAGALAIKPRFDPRPIRRATMSMRHAVGVMGIALAAHRLTERQRAQRNFDLGQELAEDYPQDWEVFCVTTNEGRCRVISRPRGGWS